MARTSTVRPGKVTMSLSEGKENIIQLAMLDFYTEKTHATKRRKFAIMQATHLLKSLHSNVKATAA